MRVLLLNGKIDGHQADSDCIRRPFQSLSLFNGVLQPTTYTT